MNKDEPFNELRIISEMLEQARKNGLSAEVVWSFANEVRNGSDMKTACSNALYEWDI